MEGDDNSILPVFFLLLLLFLAAYFAICETAFASVNRIRLKTIAEKGDRSAKKALAITERFDKAITTILIGTNIVHLAAASYVTVLVTRRWGVSKVSIGTLITTVVIFFLGEMLPKSVAKKYALRLSLGTAGSLSFFLWLFTPVSFLLTKIGALAARLTPGDSQVTVTEDELYDIIETMTDRGELDAEQGELVNNALSFDEVTVESILTARVDLVALSVDTPPEKAIELIRTVRHSRLPVYEGSIDNIIGVLQIRKYIKAWLNDRSQIDLRSLLDEAYYIHQSANIAELLPVLSRRKLNMAIVTDNYGGTLGVVTVEDILEELVGEIWDEDDVIEEPCQKNADGSYTFDSAVDIEDAFDFMDYTDPDDFDFGHKLLGEWTYEQFDQLPETGDSFTYNGLRVTVAEVEHHRIRKLLVTQETASPEEGGDTE